VVTDVGKKQRFCHYCGAEHTTKLGYCKVCGFAVCDKCGNTQHSLGEAVVVHDKCLKKGDDHFRMIKFVK
jgi:hypothetical protein